MKPATWLWGAAGLACAVAGVADERKTQVQDLLRDLAQPAQWHTGLEPAAAESLGGRHLRRCAARTRPSADCAGVLTGLEQIADSPHAPGRTDPIFKDYSLDPDLAPGACATVGVNRRYAKGSEKRCLVDLPLPPVEVSADRDISTVTAATRYMHLLSYDPADVPEIYAARGFPFATAFELPQAQLDQLARMELVLVSGGHVESMYVNGWAVPALTDYATDRKLCFGQGVDGCAPYSAEELSALPGFDVMPYLEAGWNSVLFYFSAHPPASSGVLLRLHWQSDDEENVARPDLPACAAELPEGCEYEEETVCEGTVRGECVLERRTYRCQEERSVQDRVACGMPPLCPEGGCGPDGEGEDYTADLVAALARLETARQASTYVDQERLKVFSGHEAVCRDKVAFGLGDCCRGQDTGGATTNGEALASLGISLAIRGVESLGSAHTHDLLFATDDLAGSLAGLGEGVAGLASSFTPSLSYYGLQVSVAEGALTFGFDPASFAVAVALAVIANMLECDREEQLLGLRVGARLCVKTREWCDSRSFFACRVEKEAHCCYNSRLARIIAVQGIAQLGLPADHCAGFTVEQLGQLDFDQIDLAEFVAELSPHVDSDLLERYRSDSQAGLADAIESSSAEVYAP